MKNNRLVELDSLRGIAALAVVGFHFLYRYDQIYGHSFEVPRFLEHTYFGVHLFFIISGFVIYWTISRCNTPLDFVWSRFGRLYPVFWAALLITYSAVHVFELQGREQDFTTLLANFFMFHEYFGVPHVDGVYWTLSIELAFYFWMLVIFSLGLTKYSDGIFVAWVLTAAYIEYAEIYVPMRAELLLLVNYIELFSLGICFYHYRFKTYSTITHVLFLSCVFALYMSHPIEIFGMFLVIISLFILIVLDKAKFLRNKVLVYLGTISYSLYLIHQNIGYLVILEMYELNVIPLLGVVVAFAVTISLAHVLVTFVERPTLKFLKTYYKSSLRMQQIGEKFALLSNR